MANLDVKAASDAVAIFQVENLEIERQPMPDMEAIYLISPTVPPPLLPPLLYWLRSPLRSRRTFVPDHKNAMKSKALFPCAKSEAGINTLVRTGGIRAAALP